jgi:hypothetical protein
MRESLTTSERPDMLKQSYNCEQLVICSDMKRSKCSWKLDLFTDEMRMKWKLRPAGKIQTVVYNDMRTPLQFEGFRNIFLSHGNSNVSIVAAIYMASTSTCTIMQIDLENVSKTSTLN